MNILNYAKRIKKMSILIESMKLKEESEELERELEKKDLKRMTVKEIEEIRKKCRKNIERSKELEKELENL